MMGRSKDGRRRARGADVFGINVAGEHFVVLSTPHPPTLPGGLTRAERVVVELILQGLTNADIAKRRGCTPRTVANQIASIYKKLQTGSRRALVARLLREDVRR